MTNKRFEHHLKDMIDKGWDVKGHNPDSVVDENFAQFFTYWPHNDHMTMATMSVDRFFQFIKDVQAKGGTEVQDATILAEIMRDIIKKGFAKKLSDEDNAIMGMVNATYMAATKTGKSYFEQASGQPFAFITVMYPANKGHTNFSSRPAMLVGTAIMAVDEVRALAEAVMEHDREAGKEELYKYLGNKK